MKSKFDLICLDADGVLVDWWTAMVQAHGIDPDTVTADHRVKGRMWKWMNMEEEAFYEPCNHHEFWANLPLYPWAHEVIKACQENAEDFVIATSPTRSPWAASGKSECLQKRLNIDLNDIFIGKKKYLLAGSQRLLVDDFDLNCNNFIKAGGQAFKFKEPWNPSSEGGDHKDLLKILGSNHPVIMMKFKTREWKKDHPQNFEVAV